MPINGQNPVQTQPLSSAQAIPSEMVTAKGRQQSEKRISFSYCDKIIPTFIQGEKASQSLATRLSSDLSPGITAEGPGTSFSTPLRSWTRDKTTWTTGTSGLSSPGEAGLPSSGCLPTTASQPETPSREALEASEDDEASPDPMTFPENDRGMPPPNPNAFSDEASATRVGSISPLNPPKEAPMGFLNPSNEASLSPLRAFKEGPTGLLKATTRLGRATHSVTAPRLGGRQGGARPGGFALSAAEDPNGRKASSRPSFLNDLPRYPDAGDFTSVESSKEGIASFARCGSLGSRIPGYDSTCTMQMRTMLINAERELADVREDAVKRGMLLEGLRTALDRERASVQDLRIHHLEQIDEMRSEHDAQIKQLREQIRVLKMVSETAMAEKSKADEKAVQRRKDMLTLLEKERAEKGSIMADYRVQTEELIKEQGREITFLRAAMDQIKEQYNKLVMEHEVTMSARDVLEGQFEEYKTQLDRERVEGTKRLREVQNLLINEKESLQNEIDRIREEQLRESAKWQSKQQELLDQLQRAQESVAAEEKGRNHTLESLRQAHRRELEAMCQELESAKEAYGKQASEYRIDLEKTVQSEQKASESLRQTLEQVRREKEETAVDAYMQREQLQTQHRSKISQQKAVEDALRKELAEEQRARKDAESNVELMRLRAESLQKTAHEASCGLEAFQVDQRTKERTLEQAHQRAIENIELKLHNLTSDLTCAQQKAQQEALEQQCLRDELTAKSTALERFKEEKKKTIELMEAEIARLTQDYTFRENEWKKTLDQLQINIKTMEKERLCLEKNRNEDDARLKAVAEEMAIDRASLESTNMQLREAQTLLEDLRHKYNREQELNVELVDTNQKLTEALQKLKRRSDDLEKAVQIGLSHLEESRGECRRQGAVYEGKFNELEERHKAELVGFHLVVEQAHMESSRARDLVMAKDSTLGEVREELATLRREFGLRERSMQAEMGDLKTAHEEAMQGMDELLNGLRADLAKSQAMCTEYRRELNNFNRTAEARYLDLEATLGQSEAARVRLQEDSKYRDQLNQELQSTVRLLTTRLHSHEDEINRLQEEVSDTNSRAQDAYTLIGRKDSTIGQLNAKLRAYESRGFLI
ncbi:unnamed protein product [Phytomonas sp. Hart1]|nr:unnamed protein product [Phytomonas sp. Hart1]|eukprot:CCW71783.1 unnamed protein product [Phytomonas sp. isolate Hart1]